MSTPSLETRESLIFKRGLVKRRITNLVKKIDPLVHKQDISQFDKVCAEQYLKDIRGLDEQFQANHEAASVLVAHENEELLERDFDELDAHDERVKENVSKLLFFLSTQVASVESKLNSSTDSVKRPSERKWNRITSNVNKLESRINEVQESLDSANIDDVIDLRNQFSEAEKTLDQFASDLDSVVDVDEDNWSDTVASYFDKIKTCQDTLSSLISDIRRRNQIRQQRSAKYCQNSKRLNGKIEPKNSKNGLPLNSNNGTKNSSSESFNIVRK